MTDKVIENNQVVIMGEIVSDFTFSHEIYGEGFYMVDVSVERLSDSIDIIPLMVSERLLDVNGDYKGMYIVVNGQFRSYNRHEERKNKLVLSVFAREIEFVEEIGENTKSNQIFLDGYICKEPIYRKTPLGREIADLLLAVNRPYGKSDYIPCRMGQDSKPGIYEKNIRGTVGKKGCLRGIGKQAGINGRLKNRGISIAVPKAECIGLPCLPRKNG